ncbi:MAG: hypothetical protein HQ481_02815 [Alphaproteobacteria bacterium]|nr:hypothetical protein [Alphaproteobacteria bacterium]
MTRIIAAALGLAVMGMAPAWAGEADVVGVEIAGANGVYRFSVTVRHGDTGWDHYADQWDVVAPDGTVLGARVLLHPHETEQPFTRGLAGVPIPSGVAEVTVRAHDKVHGYGGAEMTVKVPR